MTDTMNDLGAPHSTACTVADEHGTYYAAFYENGIWWLGDPTPSNPYVQLECVPATLISVDGGVG